MNRPPTRRRNPRALCSELVRVTFHDQRGRRIEETAVLEDLSQKGARLSLALPLTVGAQVKFQTSGFVVVAGVAYCELADDGYAVGLEFSPDAQWDESSWMPKHLLHIPSHEQPE
jgi:hypothetical protein